MDFCLYLWPEGVVSSIKKSQWLSKSYDAILSNNKNDFVSLDKKTIISLSPYT